MSSKSASASEKLLRGKCHPVIDDIGSMAYPAGWRELSLEQQEAWCCEQCDKIMPRLFDLDGNYQGMGPTSLSSNPIADAGGLKFCYAWGLSRHNVLGVSSGLVPSDWLWVKIALLLGCACGTFPFTLG